MVIILFSGVVCLRNRLEFKYKGIVSAYVRFHVLGIDHAVTVSTENLRDYRNERKALEINKKKGIILIDLLDFMF
jgi:hypothetical protein